MFFFAHPQWLSIENCHLSLSLFRTDQRFAFFEQQRNFSSSQPVTTVAHK